MAGIGDSECELVSFGASRGRLESGAGSTPKNLPAGLPWGLVALNDGTFLDCKSKVAFTLT